MVSALRDIVTHASTLVDLGPGDTVIDIGANDGTLLRMYPAGVRRIAYEPAENLWPALRELTWDSTKGISTIHGYFPETLGDQIVGMEPGAKIITSIACFYDVDDPNAFVEGIKKCLAPGGIWINQLAYLPETLWSNNFGDVCHEHLTYWTIRSFASLLDRHGLHISEWSFNDVNGGSVRFVVRHGAEGQRIVEGGPGIPEWQWFRERIRRQREDVRDFLLTARQRGQKVIGYGASTKGNTYLQYWGIGSDLLPLIADRNPDKFGKFTPTGQIVVSEAEARDLEPDYFFVLPFHFLDAFMQRERIFLHRGGQFVVPFPKLHLVSEGGECHPHIPKKATPADLSASLS